MKIILPIILIGLVSSQTYNEINNITLKDPSFPFYGEMYTGFITVDNSTGAKLFYHLYAANGTNLDADLPLMVWLQGGPGCSSALGDYAEIGPVQVLGSSDDIQLVPNENTWNRWAHLLFIDQPTGTGFSPDFGLNVTNTYEAAGQFNIFMARFYQLFPTLQSKGLYLFGESYAGHWVPVFTYTLLKNETFMASTQILGMGVGDGWSNGNLQSRTYSTFGYAVGIADPLETEFIRSEENAVYLYEGQKNFWQATNVSDLIADWQADYAGGMNEYNYREYSSDYGEYPTWLNMKQVQEFLEIPYTPFVDCNSDISDDFFDDTTTSIVEVYPYIFSKIPVLFYNGQDDPNCNYEGVNDYLNQLNWSDIKQFRKAPRTTWHLPNGTIGGLVKSYGNFTFAFVYKSGHMVPWFQPVSAATIVYNFLHGIPLT